MINTIIHSPDLCVIGGGLAGLTVAVEAARNGVKTLLMHERPVLGGNCSSEIRMWVCGARGNGNRETGILEEINLENLYRNPNKLYPIWDSILYSFAKREPNLELLLNCSCFSAETDKVNETEIIKSVTGWQMTTQTLHKVSSLLFADCSGDSILAPLTGAHFRLGRESVSEFGESLAQAAPDRKTMGNSCLIQARRLSYPIKFTPPEWAYHLSDKQAKARLKSIKLDDPLENFWYLELGGDSESGVLEGAEEIRDRLLRLAFGVWDHIKNSGDYPADNWQLDFVGFLPAKRESRRMCGKYILTQNDIMSNKNFSDTVAYGGWPLDDHDPLGFASEGRMNTNLKPPSPFGIPYRTMYSENIENLFFAGRNISLTHAAMSSARVMATCAVIGQAVGCAASVAVKYKTTPHGVYTDHIEELKENLQYHDCFIPGTCRSVSNACGEARLFCITPEGNETVPDGIYVLRNCLERNHPIYGEQDMAFSCPNGYTLCYELKVPRLVREVRMVFDSDLERSTVAEGASKVEREHSMRANIWDGQPEMHLPTTLVRAFSIVTENENGQRKTVYKTDNNIKRLQIIKINENVKKIELAAVTPSASVSRIFTFEFK